MKVYVIVSLDNGIPFVEAVLSTEDAAHQYFDELIARMGGEWEEPKYEGPCIRYASNDDIDADLRIYERNLL